MQEKKNVLQGVFSGKGHYNQSSICTDEQKYYFRHFTNKEQKTRVILAITIINNIITFHVKSNRNILYTECPYFAMIPAPPVPVG